MGRPRQPLAAVPPPTSEAKCASMRSASGAMPVNRRNASTAWNTAMAPPCKVRQPSARAVRSNSVSSGK
jgi:hypothetical protein